MTDPGPAGELRDAMAGGLAADGVISAPEIQAMMLEPAGIEPGMRVLEVGIGGYNAALIAELAGPGGQVTSVDIDPEVTARARACLDAAGSLGAGDGQCRNFHCFARSPPAGPAVPRTGPLN